MLLTCCTPLPRWHDGVTAVLAAARLPPSCRPARVASPAATTSAKSAVFLLIGFPPAFDVLYDAAEPLARGPPDGLRGGDLEVTKSLQPARTGCAEELAGLRLCKPHALVHLLERRLARPAGLIRSNGEKPLQLALIRTKLLEPLADRRQQLDHRLADGL